MACDQHQTAVKSKKLQLTIGVGAGLRIEDDVDTCIARRRAQRLHPVRPIIEGDFRAEVTTDLSFLFRSGGGKNTCPAQQFRNLDRRHPDAAGSALHEDALALGKPCE